MTWVRAGSVSSLAGGEAKVVEAGDRRIALCRVGDAVFAIEDVCSHDGGALDQGTVDGFEIECPRHGARFDVRNGKVLSLPAVRPIKSFATRAVDGTIEVEVP